MTESEIISLIETTLHEKIEKDVNFIKYSFYETHVKYNLNENELYTFLRLLTIKLKNCNYNVYTEGQEFEFNDKKMKVQNNESLVAIRNVERRSTKNGK